MKSVKKAIIPAAGWGTRFLPATKAMPKEMLPVVDKPAIQYIVEEAVASGIEDIIIVTGRSKRAIEDHFDRNVELELLLEEKGKLEFLRVIREVTELVNIYYVRQKQALGLGHAIWCARKFVGNEPFAVLLGDIIIDGGQDRPCMQQLIEVYGQTQSMVIGVAPVPWKETEKYGIVSGQPAEAPGVLLLDGLVEKPRSHPPSNLAIIGRYVLGPEVFSHLEKMHIGAGGEVQLTDALQELVRQGPPMVALEIKGNVYDVGDKLGFLKATVELACRDPNMSLPFTSYLNAYLKKHHHEQGGNSDG